MNVSEIQLFYHPKDRLRMTHGDVSYVTVKPVWASPLTRPNQYLSLMNGKGEEIVLIENIDQLTSDSQNAVREELRRRYLTSQIHRVLSAKTEFGATYWHVVTDRGERDFVTQSLQENAQWLGTGHLLLLDVDGNRFELPNIPDLDANSQRILATVL